ncbi:hypothetical protein G6F31_019258 [Rhizopus arrhizus]|nr:hypothetical protein G6F31_019258 [Rhizopus arrhizus]
MPSCRLSLFAVLTASTMWLSGASAPLENTFWPVISQSSPSRRALVVSDAASDPELGSVRLNDSLASPCATRGRNSRFNSSGATSARIEQPQACSAMRVAKSTLGLATSS